MKARMVFILAVALATMASAQAVKVVGVFKPGIEHGKLTAAQAETVRRAKAAVVGGSMKLKADKTFGVSFAGRIMFGTYTIKGNILTINVKEIVGKSAKDVAKMKPDERTAQFAITQGGKKLLSLPDKGPGKPRIVWKMQAGS